MDQFFHPRISHCVQNPWVGRRPDDDGRVPNLWQQIPSVTASYTKFQVPWKQIMATKSRYWAPLLFCPSCKTAAVPTHIDLTALNSVYPTTKASTSVSRQFGWFHDAFRKNWNENNCIYKIIENGLLKVTANWKYERKNNNYYKSDFTESYFMITLKYCMLIRDVMWRCVVWLQLRTYKS